MSFIFISLLKFKYFTSVFSLDSCVQYSKTFNFISCIMFDEFVVLILAYTFIGFQVEMNQHSCPDQFHLIYTLHNTSSYDGEPSCYKFEFKAVTYPVGNFSQTIVLTPNWHNCKFSTKKMLSLVGKIWKYKQN